MKLLSFWVSRITNSPNLRKILGNIGWLFGEKALSMGVGVIVTVWLARYLGPEQFGLYNFALAFVGLFSPFAMLGLSGIVVRELVNKPELTNEILGTSAILHLLGGFIAFVFAYTVIHLLRPDDQISQIAVTIVAFSLLFKFGSPIACWFEAQVKSKYTVLAVNSVLIISAATKIVLILNAASLLHFLWIALAEAMLVCLAMFLVYSLTGGRAAYWVLKVNQAKYLLGSCWPLLLSGISALIYTSIDKVMIGQLIDNEAVGIYSSAVSISQVWGFIPTVVVASVFPAILRARRKKSSLYFGRLQILFDGLVTMSVLLAILFAFISEPVITLVFGDIYREAAIILSIHIWTGVFAAMSVTSYYWLIAENRQILSLQRAALGAATNVILNLKLIAMLGVTGAAIGTLVSCAVASLFFDLLQKETRKIFAMKLRSLNPLGVFKRYSREAYLWGEQ